MERGGEDGPGRRWVGVGIGLAAVLVIGLVVATRGDGSGNGDGDAASPREAVDGFFAAQAAGDCPGLLALLTEESWSDGGRWSADEFLAQCEDALGGDRPAPGQPAPVDVDSEPPNAGPPDDGDRLDVTSSDHQGSLVREDGRWKVELDPFVLHLGRTPSETVAAYVDAYNAGDCEAMLDLLSERAWSRDGRRSSDEFLADCAARAEVRRASDEVAVVLDEVTPTAEDGDNGEAATAATAAVRFATPLAPVGDPPDSVRLVTEGLEWVLDANVARPDAEPLLLELSYRELQARLLDEVVVDGKSCAGTDGLAEAPGVVAGLRRTYFECSVRVSLLEHTDPEAAAGAVNTLTTQLLEADDSARAVPVPGNADAVAVVGDCDLGQCTAASVMQVGGNVVVHVELQTSDDVATGASILQEQLER